MSGAAVKLLLNKKLASQVNFDFDTNGLCLILDLDK